MNGAQDDFTIISKKGDNYELANCEDTLNKVYIKEYIGINSENSTGTQNYVIYKYITPTEKLKLFFVLYKIQTRQYIYINNTHMMECSRFLQIENILSHSNAIIMKNVTVKEEIIIEKCDMDMIKKCINIVQEYKNRVPSKTFLDYLEYLFM